MPAGPWEKYADTAAPPASGPWEKYGVQPAQSPAQAPVSTGTRRSANPKGTSADVAARRREAITGLIHSYPGYDQMGEGSDQLMTPGQRKEGLHNLVTGAGKFASPLLIPEVAANPIGVATALGAGMVAAPVARTGAKLAGAEDDTADLVGDAAGIGAGYAAGYVPGVGQAARAGAKTVLTPKPGGRLARAAEAMSDAWRNARAGTPASPPAGAAPGPKAAPPTGPKAAPTVIPPSRQLAAAPRVFEQPPIADTSGVIKGWAPTILENERPTVKAAPKAAPVEPSKADLDSVVRNLGGKDYASANPTIQKLARDAVSQKGAPVTTPIARYTPPPAPPVAQAAPVVTPEPVAAKAEAPAPVAVPETPAPAVVPAPPEPAVPAPPAANPEAIGPIGHTGEGFDYKQIARDMRGKGSTRANVVASRDQLLKSGYDVDRYNRLLSEVSQQEKDHAILDKLAQDGKTTEAHIKAMSDDELEKAINSTPRKSGKGNYRSKSGDHSRSLAEQREDLIEELKHRPATPAAEDDEEE